MSDDIDKHLIMKCQYLLTERNNMCNQMTWLNIWLWNGNTY